MNIFGKVGNAVEFLIVGRKIVRFYGDNFQQSVLIVLAIIKLDIFSHLEITRIKTIVKPLERTK